MDSSRVSIGELRGSPRTPNSPRVIRNRREDFPPGVSRFPVSPQAFAVRERLSPGSPFRNRKIGHLAEPGAFRHGDRKIGFELSNARITRYHGVNSPISLGGPWRFRNLAQIHTGARCGGRVEPFRHGVNRSARRGRGDLRAISVARMAWYCETGYPPGRWSALTFGRERDRSCVQPSFGLLRHQLVVN
jgi:hypothetical protein